MCVFICCVWDTKVLMTHCSSQRHCNTPHTFLPCFFFLWQGVFSELWNVCKSTSHFMGEQIDVPSAVLILLHSSYTDRNVKSESAASLNLKGLLILLRCWLEIKSSAHSCGGVRNFVILDQKWCHQFSFVCLTFFFFCPCIHHTRGKKLNLNNLNHFLTFVPTSNRSVWSPSANLRDMNNQPGFCLTENKPGNTTCLSLYVQQYFEVQRNGIWRTGNERTGVSDGDRKWRFQQCFF